jgi:broad specificity phosphatase PhoE
VTQTLILVRHGEAEGSRPGVLCGRSDPALSEAGRRQAALLQGMMGRLPEARLVASPLTRARETAEIAVECLPAVVETDPDLQEMDFGDWEGLTYDDVAARYPGLVSGWTEFRPDFGFPGGETLTDFASRIERVAARLADTGAATVVAFTHGGVVRALICHFLGLPLRDYLLFDVSPGSVATLRLWGERGVLAGLGPADTFSGPRCV